MIKIFLLSYDFVQKMWSYILMLISMTYNGWVCLSLILGLTLGYSFQQIDMEYHQIIQAV